MEQIGNKMTPNKYDGRHNLKYKGTSVLQEHKRTPNTFLNSRKKCDNVIKSKLESVKPTPVTTKTWKHHNCLTLETPTCKKTQPPPLSLKRKSISLVELTGSNTTWNQKNHSRKELKDDIKLASTTIKRSPYIGSMEESKIARKVCKMFILNAWRQRRKQSAVLQNKAQKLENEVENLNIQTVVLKNLLASEEVRTAVALSDSAHLRQLLENELKCTGDLKKNLSQLGSEKELLEKKCSEMESEIKSLKDNLASSNEKNVLLKRECESYLQHLTNSRDNESKVLTKLSVAQTCLKENIIELQKMKKKSLDSEAQITDLKSKNQKLCSEKEMKENEINEYVTKIKKKDGELNNLHNIRKVQNENIVNLAKDVAAAKEQIKQKDSTIEDLEEAIKQYEAEKQEFEETLREGRNRFIFEAVKVCANLFFPNPNKMLI